MFAATRRFAVAYLATEYRVGGVVLRIGVRSAWLDRALGPHRWAAFLTAANPRSRQLARGVNARRQASLRAMLRAGGFRCFDGMAHDPAGAWPDEPSVLVLGLRPARAAAVARAFRQNAVVILRSGRPAMLRPLR